MECGECGEARAVVARMDRKESVEYRCIGMTICGSSIVVLVCVRI